jgi:FkbM family methyltransferase
MEQNSALQNLDLKNIVESIFRLIPSIRQQLSLDSELCLTLNKIVRAYFSNYTSDVLNIIPFDGMIWPHTNVGSGTFTSYDFFSLHEMPIYCFYWINKNNYKTVFDIGANIGIDSVILSRFGYEVYSFEPDPTVYEILTKNLRLNQCKNVHTFQKAVSNNSEIVDFIRVEGNTAASHIQGSRDFYGESKNIKIETIAFCDIGVQPDLMKINVEGHEKHIVPSIDYSLWKNMDAFIDTHNRENSVAMFDYFSKGNINIFAQRLGWQKVKRFEDMPIENTEGYIFVSKKPEMPGLHTQ